MDQGTLLRRLHGWAPGLCRSYKTRAEGLLGGLCSTKLEPWACKVGRRRRLLLMSSPPRKIPASLRTHHCWHRLLPSTTGTARLFAHTLLVASLLATLLLACFCLPSQLPCWTSTAVLLLPQTLCATIVFLSAAADLYALPMHSRVPSVLNLCSG